MNIKNVWVDPNQERYFLIPNDYRFPAGYFELCGVNGEQKQADLASIVGFEVTEAQAKAHFKAAIGQSLQQAMGFVDNFAESFEQIESQEIGDFFIALQALLEGVVDQDETQKEKSKIYIRRLQKSLEAQGIKLEGNWEVAPDILQTWCQSVSDEQNLRELGVKLVEFVGQSVESSHTLGQQIDAAIKELERAFGDLIPQVRSARAREKRKESARQTARMDIAKSLRARGITPIASVQETSVRAEPSEKGID